MSHECFINDTIYERNVISPEHLDLLLGLAKFESEKRDYGDFSPEARKKRFGSDSNLLNCNGFTNSSLSPSPDEDTKSTLDGNNLLSKIGSF